MILSRNTEQLFFFQFRRDQIGATVGAERGKKSHLFALSKLVHRGRL